jgi:glutamyl-tRNA synthetase
MEDNKILHLLKNYLSTTEFNSNKFSDEKLLQIIGAMKERVTFIHEFVESCKYFYEEPKEYEQKSIEKNWKEETPNHLKKLKDEFEKLIDPTKEDYEKVLSKVAEELNVGKGKLIHPLRLAVSGQSTGPGMFDLLFILGKDEIISRIQKAIDAIKTS